jgi:hypothetical protein
MFAIIMPVVVAPTLVILFWADIQAKKMGVGVRSPEAQAARDQRSWFQATKDFAEDIDALGLILIGSSWSLLFIPFTLSTTADRGYANREYKSPSP